MTVARLRPAEMEDAMRRSLVTAAAACLAVSCLLVPTASGSAPKLVIVEDFVDYVG